MGVMSGTRHWISISNGFLDIESAHIFVDRVKTCVFWHTLVLGLVICADHPKSDEYFSDPKLAAYAVPYSPAILGRHIGKYYLQKQVEFLRTSIHWKKAYFYLWDEPLNIEHYDSLLNMAKEIHAYAPDARILTTYYGGPTDTPLTPTPFEAFVKVPKFPHPHNQIYCTRVSNMSTGHDSLTTRPIGPSDWHMAY